MAQVGAQVSLSVSLVCLYLNSLAPTGKATQWNGLFVGRLAHIIRSYHKAGIIAPGQGLG